jgi:hypothetical protein
MLQLRLLTESDADEFWHFRLSGLQESPNAFAESVEELQAMSPAANADRLRASTPHNFVLGAFEDRRLVGTAGFSGSPASLADSGDDAVDGNRVVRIDRVQAFWFQKPKSPCRRCFCRGRTPRVHAGCIFGPAAVAILIASSKQIGVSGYLESALRMSMGV